MASWSFILTDNAYNHVGEILNASERKVALPLSKLATASFRVRLDNPLADLLASCEGYVKGYRDGVLRLFAPIISAEEIADKDNASVMVNCVDAGWYMQKRLAGKSAAGTIFGSATDRAQIVKQLLDTANAEGETGISTSAMPISAASAVTYTAGPYKPILECNSELAVSTDGFDWRIVPIENFDNGTVTGQKIAAFWAEPVIGQERLDAVFEWGTGRNNIVSYTRSVTRDTQANKVYHFTSNGPDAPGYPTLSAIDATSVANWKLLEDLAQADLLDPTLRQRLVDTHVEVRKNPRQIITFQPHINPQGSMRVPDFGTDFDVGDLIPARAKYGDTVRFDATFRLWGVEFAIDNHGVETPTFTLAEE